MQKSTSKPPQFTRVLLQRVTGLEVIMSLNVTEERAPEWGP
ncbi:MAG: hypothetical protein RH862_16030 [Leptospiraceae bacterium]